MSTDPTVQQPGDRGRADDAAARFDRWQRAGSWVAPVLTALLAFLAGGLVVLATGHSPIKVYQGIWEGTGLSGSSRWAPTRWGSRSRTQRSGSRGT